MTKELWRDHAGERENEFDFVVGYTSWQDGQLPHDGTTWWAIESSNGEQIRVPFFFLIGKGHLEQMDTEEYRKNLRENAYKHARHFFKDVGSWLEEAK